MSHPIVSVIMSVYNGEQYLPAAIDSVLTQSFTNFEKNKIHVMKADATKVDESILNFLKSVERAGLPVYAYYQNGQERPILLPESFSKDEFINLMEGLFF